MRFVYIALLVLCTASYAAAHAELPIHIDCDMCMAGVDLAEKLIGLNYTLEKMQKPFIEFCNKFVFPKSEHPMCPGLVQIYAPSVLYVLTHTVASPRTICTQLRFCTNDSLVPKLPKMLDSESMFVKAPAALEPNQEPLRVLQLTDMHFDVLYQPGSMADCGDIVCCRPDDFTGTRRAGYWGDYACDLPVATLQSMLSFIKNELKPVDMIIWTGDNPPHDLWIQTLEWQLNATIGATNMLRDMFTPDTDIFPCMGNHESYPANLYYEPQYKWLTDMLGSLWAPWLPEDAVKTVKEMGFYTATVRPGLRIFAMNSQLGYVFNFYSLLPDRDVTDAQFAALRQTLMEAEQAGDKVMIISHHPPFRYDCLDFYASQWHEIFSQYSHVIVGQFAGHTHTDLFQVVKHINTSNPIGMVYVSPAVTTMTDINPSFRVYLLHPTTFEVLDYEQHHMNLTRANLENKPTWELWYTARQQFGLADLSPASWMKASQDMATNSKAAAAYKNIQKTGTHGVAPCSANCMHSVFCQTQSTTYSLYLQCMAARADS